MSSIGLFAIVGASKEILNSDDLLFINADRRNCLSLLQDNTGEKWDISGTKLSLLPLDFL